MTHSLYKSFRFTPTEDAKKLVELLFVEWASPRAPAKNGQITNLAEIKYLNLKQFHLFLCVLMGCGVVEESYFDLNIFHKLSKHKQKLYFQFIIFTSGSIKLTGLVYDETESRMGLRIKKAILRTFIEHNYNLEYEEKASKAASKGLFYFE